jgi:hypothetical protein
MLVPDSLPDSTPTAAATAAAVPWWKSQIIRRLALSIVTQILALCHLSKYVAPADLSMLVDQLLEAAGIGYAAWAVHARATKPLPPVAISQAAADKANAAGRADPNPTQPPQAAKSNP